MKIGLQIPRFTWPGDESDISPKLTEIARTADEAGFASLWVMDHYFQIPGVGQAEEPMLEGYGALSFLAAVTNHVRLGTLVTGINYRHPGFLIKSVTGLDVLSGGRAYLGIGAGWFEREAHGLGFPYPPLAERFERLEEVLQISQHMWSEEVVPYHGTHYRLEEPLCRPLPISEPHPPILIGGMGEQKTLRLVAEYADACNLFMRVGMDTLRHKLDVLRNHCRDVGRPYEEIEKTTLGTVHLAPGEMSADQVIEQCRDLAELGIDHAIFNMPNVHEISPLQQFGEEIIPAVASL